MNVWIDDRQTDRQIDRKTDNNGNPAICHDLDHSAGHNAE